jgi:hypothetical protein
MTTTSTATTATTTTAGQKKRKKKHCSNCGMPGHQWQTCTEPRRSVVAIDDDENDDGDDDDDENDNENEDLRAASTATLPARPRGKILTTDQKIDALRILLECIKEKEKGTPVQTSNPFKRATVYGGVSEPVLRRLYRFWRATGAVEPTLTRRGKYVRRKHECWTRHWLTVIGETVRALNKRGAPATIKTIMAELDLEKQYGIVMSERTLNRVLIEIGFRYQDASRAAQSYVETESIRRDRASYLRERKRIRTEEPDTIEIWLDESYCNQRHVAPRTWFSKKDKKDTVKRGSGKGPRWMIVHAGSAECGWIGEPLVVKAKKTNSGDYHKNMDSDMFQSYFEDLCKHVKEKFPDRRKVVFHMDNASYHKKVVGLENETLSGLKKKQLLKWLKDQGAENNEMYEYHVRDGQKKKKKEGGAPALKRMTKKRDELYKVAKEKYKGKTITEATAEKYGYRVLWIPPYHPMLNPIEEAWGVTKGFVACKNDGNSFERVKTLIFGGFDKVTKEMWEKLVRRTYRNEDEMIEERNIPLFTNEEMEEMMIPIDESDREEEDDNDNDSESVVVEITQKKRRRMDGRSEGEGSERWDVNAASSSSRVDGGDDNDDDGANIDKVEGENEGENGPRRSRREKGKWKERDVEAEDAAQTHDDDRYGLASIGYEDIFEDFDVTRELVE